MSAGLRPLAHGADVQLGHHVGPKQLEQGLFQKHLLPVGYDLPAELPCLISVGKDAPSPAET